MVGWRGGEGHRHLVLLPHSRRGNESSHPLLASLIRRLTLSFPEIRPRFLASANNIMACPALPVTAPAAAARTMARICDAAIAMARECPAAPMVVPTPATAPRQPRPGSCTGTSGHTTSISHRQHLQQHRPPRHRLLPPPLPRLRLGGVASRRHLPSPPLLLLLLLLPRQQGVVRRRLGSVTCACLTLRTPVTGIRCMTWWS